MSATVGDIACSTSITDITLYSSWGGGGTLAIATGIAVFLATKAESIWRWVQRRWAGEAGFQEINQKYKEARSAIISKTKSDWERQELMRDLRAEMRNRYPQWADRWN